jgi:hypothetical protein
MARRALDADVHQPTQAAAEGEPEAGAAELPAWPHPARGIKRAKEAPGRVRYLSPEGRDKLLNGADMTVTAKDGRTSTTHRAPNPALRIYILAVHYRPAPAGASWHC